MKIAVCIKQVPTREWQPRLNDDKTWIREQDASYEMNEPDAYALEEALRLREKHGGEVVVCSAGPARVQQVIREALARGADRAHSRRGRRAGAADAFTAAAALAPAMQRGAVRSGAHRPAVRRSGPRAGRRRCSPRSSACRTRRSSWTCRSPTAGCDLRVKRELEGGWFQWVAMPLPALLTIQSGINQLRYATLKGIMAAKKKEIRKVAPPAGARAAPEDRRRSTCRQKSKQTQMIGGSPAEAAEGAGAAAAREARVTVILVIAEQRDGKLNRASWEAIAAAQQLAGQAPVKIAVLGQSVRRRSPASWRRPRCAEVIARRARGARHVHARRIRAGAARRSSAQSRRTSWCCRTPIRRATSRRRWPRASIARSSPTSSPSSAGGDGRRSRGRCSRASWSPTSCRRAGAASRHVSRSARFAPTPCRRAAPPAPVRVAARSMPRAIRQQARGAVPGGEAGGRSVAGRADRRRRPRHQGAGAHRGGARNWPRRWAPSSPRRVRSATTAGCRWSARSAAPARPWRRSSTSRSASPAPSSTWSA